MRKQKTVIALSVLLSFLTLSSSFAQTLTLDELNKRVYSTSVYRSVLQKLGLIPSLRLKAEPYTGPPASVNSIVRYTANASADSDQDVEPAIYTKTDETGATRTTTTYIKVLPDGGGGFIHRNYFCQYD